MNSIKRRRLLAASAAGAGTVLAGCLGDFEDPEQSSSVRTGSEGSDDGENGSNESERDGSDGAEESDGEDGESMPTLYYVDVENNNDEAHTIHVIVEQSNELVNWSSIDLEAYERRSVERTWETDPGEYTVSVRVDDRRSWERVDLTQERPTCYGVAPRIDDDGDVAIWWERDPPGCRNRRE